VFRESCFHFLPMCINLFEAGPGIVHGKVSADVRGPAHMAEAVVTIAFLEC
jgi:hypothetical protein